MNDLPYEFCALRFLLQWERAEEKLRDEFRDGPTVKELRRALKHFQVARNFKGLKSDDVANSIIVALNKVATTSAPPEQKVVALAKKFRSEFSQFNLSAASKLLWLKGDNRVIIYDSRAVAALYEMDCAFEKRDYRAYCESWRKQFSVRRKKIRAAARRLPEARGFLPLKYQKSRLDALITKRWFVDRIFDIYLWEAGAEG